MRKAQVKGALKKGGRVVSMQLWARPKVKAIIVRAAKKEKMSVSRLMLRLTLEAIALDQGCKLTELLNADDLAAIMDGRRRA